MVFYSTPLFLFYILATMSLDDSEQQYVYSEIYFANLYNIHTTIVKNENLT